MTAPVSPTPSPSLRELAKVYDAALARLSEIEDHPLADETTRPAVHKEAEEAFSEALQTLDDFVQEEIGHEGVLRLMDDLDTERAIVVELNALGDKLYADVVRLSVELDAALARAAWSLTLAKSALENWGRHHLDCAYLLPIPGTGRIAKPCDCGLAKAIREAMHP